MRHKIIHSKNEYNFDIYQKYRNQNIVKKETFEF